jgi:hypothetical protein
MNLMERLALAALRGWTRSYTVALPVPTRDARRRELAADTHDHLADLRARAVSGRRSAVEILGRLVRGMPDDVRWALTMTLEEAMPRTRTLAIAGWCYALLVAVFALLGAVEGLAHGWRELPEHWWSTFAAASVGVALAGLVTTLATTVSGPAEGS